MLIGGEDEEFVDAEKRDSMLEEKSDKLKKHLKKFCLIMIFGQISFGREPSAKLKTACLISANILTFQALILCWDLAETGSPFR